MHLKMVKLINFKLHVFYHNKKDLDKQMKVEMLVHSSTRPHKFSFKDSCSNKSLGLNEWGNWWYIAVGMAMNTAMPVRPW